MTPTELRAQLTTQYNEQLLTLKVIEGAIAACDQLLNQPESDNTEDEE